MKMRPKDLKKRLMVKFRGEEGLDYGGVARSVHLWVKCTLFTRLISNIIFHLLVRIKLCFFTQLNKSGKHKICFI